MPFALSTFLQFTLAALLVVPVIILWAVAVVDVVRRGGSGLRIAAILVLILIVPILGPLLYLVFLRPEDEAASPAAVHAAQEDMRRSGAYR